MLAQITVGSVGAEGRIDWRVHVRSKRRCMMHDFGVTASRVVLFDCPMARGDVLPVLDQHTACSALVYIS